MNGLPADIKTLIIPEKNPPDFELCETHEGTQITALSKRGLEHIDPPLFVETGSPMWEFIETLVDRLKTNHNLTFRKTVRAADLTIRILAAGGLEITANTPLGSSYAERKLMVNGKLDVPLQIVADALRMSLKEAGLSVEMKSDL